MNCPHGNNKEECVKCYWESRIGWELENPTLRDQFAMAALTGLVSSLGDTDNEYFMFAGDAYLLADAMLEARKVKP